MKEEVPVASQIAAWVLERIFDLLMALVVFGFALSHLAATGLHGGSKLAWVFATGGRAGAVCAAKWPVPESQAANTRKLRRVTI